MLFASLAFVIAAATPALAQDRNQACTVKDGVNSQNGVCLWTNECRQGGGTPIPGFCRGSADDIQCCLSGAIKRGCNWVVRGKCPGGEDVLFVKAFGACYNTIPGRCPGPWDFRWVESYYGPAIA